MDKVYEKTRYQNIYRHKKNKNYIIMISSPVKTSIAKLNGEKIFDIEVAKNYKMKLELKGEKIIKQTNSMLIKDLWKQYIDHCLTIAKLSYNTIKKKKSIYNCFLKDLDNIKITTFTKQSIADYIANLITTDKQKNTTLIILKGFLNWCVEQEIINNNPANGIKNIRVNKVEMKYWNAEQFKTFMSYISNINTPNAKMIKTLVIIEFNLGDRIGETRALTWQSINKDNNEIKVKHSINYDPNSKDYLSNTKNYQSERIVNISSKFIEFIDEYKGYLEDLYGSVNDIIFWNYKLHKPYSDTNLRKYFYKYCEEAKVPQIRLYDLRHTYVTLMMSEGWQLYHISKRIGHKNYATTVDKYGHIEENLRKEIANTTDKFF